MNGPRFLIDENLSVRLPEAAHRRGYEAAHVARIGLAGWKDWSLLDFAHAGSWVLVTNNAIEFRGRLASRDLHPGVVFLLPSIPRLSQHELFSAALDDVDRDPELTDTAIDVSYAGRNVVVRRYRLP